MLSTLYLTLQAAPNGVVSVGCSDPIKQLPLPNGHGREFAFAAVHAMAWDLVAFAAIKGCRVDGVAAPERINPVLLVGLANALLDPEALGYVVNGEVRDMARLALGKKPVESYLCPGWKPAPLRVVVAPDWSAA